MELSTPTCADMWGIFVRDLDESYNLGRIRDLSHQLVHYFMLSAVLPYRSVGLRTFHRKLFDDRLCKVDWT